jgi:myo-inositol-1(or 4)-monophosphatase
MADLEKICHEVTLLARETGTFIRNERMSFSIDSVERKGHNDLVSYVDKGAEEKIVNRLRELIPDAGFITEENTVARQDAEWQWIVDPLDGTTNFVHGLPCFCISIALTRNGKLCLGVIYEVNLDECFYSWEGEAAFLNGRKIQVSSIPSIKDSLLATGFPYTNYSRLKPYMEVFDHYMRHSHGLRRLGSAAADLAYVACGRFEGFYEYGLQPWDVAAGAFLVQQAGGTVGDFSGKINFLFGKEMIAANNHVYPEMLKLIREKFGLDSL